MSRVPLPAFLPDIGTSAAGQEPESLPERADCRPGLQASCDLEDRNYLEKRAGPPPRRQQGAAEPWDGGRAVTGVATLHFHSSSHVRFLLSPFCRTDPEIAPFNPQSYIANISPLTACLSVALIQRDRDPGSWATVCKQEISLEGRHTTGPANLPEAEKRIFRGNIGPVLLPGPSVSTFTWH